MLHLQRLSLKAIVHRIAETSKYIEDFFFFFFFFFEYGFYFIE